MLRKLIAIDSAYAYRLASEAGFKDFPVGEFRDLVRGRAGYSDGIATQGDGIDVIETLITVVKRVPEGDSDAEIAQVNRQVDSIQHALEMRGCRVIICPAKRSSQGFKQSDDQRLMMATISTCLQLRPDFLVLVAGDGDYSALVWELRHAGVRTEVVGMMSSVATDLRRAAFSVIDLRTVFDAIKEGSK